MPTFDTVCEPNMVEVKNAVDTSTKEIATRFDVQKMGGDKVKQVIKVRNGISAEDAKKIQRIIKDSKIKVQASIQGDAVRVTGTKRDDLQAVMALLRKDITDLPISFDNFRD